MSPEPKERGQVAHEDTYRHRVAAGSPTGGQFAASLVGAEASGVLTMEGASGWQLTADGSRKVDRSYHTTASVLETANAENAPASYSHSARTVAAGTVQSALFDLDEPTPSTIGAALAALNDRVVARAINADLHGCGADTFRSILEAIPDQPYVDCGITAAGRIVPLDDNPTDVRTPADYALADARIDCLIISASSDQQAAGALYLKALLLAARSNREDELADAQRLAVKAWVSNVDNDDARTLFDHISLRLGK